MKFKQIIVGSLASMLLVVPFGIGANALSQGYVSNLAIAPRVTHDGADRSYDYPNYKVEMKSTYFYYTFEEGGLYCLEHEDHKYQNVAETTITVLKKGWFGITSNEKSGKIHHTALQQSKTAILGNSGAGKRVFRFKAGTMGIHADPVTMTSYQ